MRTRHDDADMYSYTEFLHFIAGHDWCSALSIDVFVLTSPSERLKSASITSSTVNIHEAISPRVSVATTGCTFVLSLSDRTYKIWYAETATIRTCITNTRLRVVILRLTDYIHILQGSPPIHTGAESTYSSEGVKRLCQ